MSKACSVCGKELERRSISGLCKPHFLEYLNTDPEVRARQQAALRKWAKDNPAAVGARSIRQWESRRADPERMAAQAEMMRTVCQPASTTPEAIARRDTAARAKAISRARNPWCPDEYRAEYLKLVRNHKIKGAEAKAIILAQIAADAAKLSPFERQDRALRNGAPLIANDVAPMFGEAVKSA